MLIIYKKKLIVDVLERRLIQHWVDCMQYFFLDNSRGLGLDLVSG